MSTPASKICPPDALAARLALLPRPLVMTNGVFDVLHRGHVSYLQQASELGGTLLVALNSDPSARLLGKGPDRPLNKAEDRAYVLAALSCVSLVTFFDQATPVALIQATRPDIYVKGGDYDMETLEETRVVRQWGGQSLAIPFVPGFSTTSLVERIRHPEPLRQAAFLDRDGVINRDRAYVHRWEDFEFMPGAIDGMRQLQQAGYALVVVTNQSGLARGYFTARQYQQLTDAMLRELAQRGVRVEGVFHCPHHPQGNVKELAIDCDCRKPAPGLIAQAARELGLDLSASILIGDKPSDIQAAQAAGVGRAYLVDSDNPESGQAVALASGHYPNLQACARAVLAGQTQENCS